MLGGTENPGTGEIREGDPECRGYFAVGEEPDRLGNREHEGANQNRWKHRARGSQIIELTQPIGSLEDYPNLFTGFPDGGCQQIGIIRRGSPSRKREVA